MINLESGKKYTSANSGLVVKVLNIINLQGKNYFKLKIAIYRKSNGDLMEVPKYYKIGNGQIDHWKLVS